MSLISSNTAKQRGFTLIEIMVVMVILATMAAMIASGIQNGGDRNAKLEAQRFIAIVNEVRDESVISGKNILLKVGDGRDSYSFTLQRPQQGGVIDGLFKTRHIHKSVSIRWEVFERFSDDGDSDESNVLITPLGEITPFRARFTGEERDFVVSLNDDGELFAEPKASGTG